MSAELTATARERTGKGAARALRRQGLVPGIVYGDGKPDVPVVLKYNDANRRIHMGGFLSHVITLEVDGESVRVIPRDYQLEPVRDVLLHVDFLRVSKTSRLTVEVPVHFVNEAESPGLKRGGVLNIVRHTIEVTAPAEEIPESFSFDLAGLDIGDAVHISAITLPEGVRLTIADRDFTVATVAAPSVLRIEEEEEAEEGEEGEELEEGEEGAEAEEGAEEAKPESEEEE